jgi:hypothetical protein
MSLFKFSRLNFHQDFFEKRIMPPFCTNVNNKISNQDFFNKNTYDADLYPKGVIALNMVPPYLELEINALKSIFACYKAPTHKGFFIDIQEFDTIDAYLKFKFNSNSRYNLRNRLKRLETCFDISYKMYYGEIDKNHYDFLFDELEQMIQKRFNERKDKHAHIWNWDFYKNSVYSLILNKGASLFVIYNKNKPIGITINYLHQNIFEYAIPSYDINYSKFGIGNVVIMKQLEWCFQNGYKIMSMGWGDLDYKRAWCNVISKYESQVFYDKKKINEKLLAHFYVKLIVFKIYLKEKYFLRINRLIKLFKKKSSNKTKINIKNDLLNISDKFLNNDSYKIDIYKSEYSFLLPHIYNFQYINLVNSKDIEVYKIDENQETNSFIISGKSKIEKIKFFSLLFFLLFMLHI